MVSFTKSLNGLPRQNTHLSERHRGAPLLPTAAMHHNHARAAPSQTQGYQRKVGSVQYAASGTRPDVAKAASLLAEHLTNPAIHHSAAVDGELQYLASTKHLALEYGPEENDASGLVIYSDALSEMTLRPAAALTVTSSASSETSLIGKQENNMQLLLLKLNYTGSNKNTKLGGSKYRGSTAKI